MNTQKIDVLAVMARLIGNTRTMVGLTGDPMMREHLREGEDARAAVAELIEAAVCLSDSVDDGGCCDSRHGPRAMRRLDAALARIGGAA